MLLRFTLLFSFTLFTSFISIGQKKNPYSDIIINDCQNMVNALCSGNIEKFVDYMPKEVIEQLGGRKSIIKNMESDSNLKGLKDTEILFGSPERIFKYKDSFQCLVPQIIKIRTNDGEIYSKTYLIAISVNDGVNWSFVDIRGLKSNKDFPIKLNSRIKIPKIIGPYFTSSKY